MEGKKLSVRKQRIKTEDIRGQGRNLKVFDSTNSGKNRIGRMTRKRRLRKTRNITLILLLFSVLLLAFNWALKSPAFEIESISVEGLASSNPGDLIVESGIREGDNIIQVVLSGSYHAKKRLTEAYGFINKIKIGIAAGRNIVIKITEREPIARAELDNEKYYIDKNYVLYKNDGVDNSDEMITVKGLNIAGGKSSEDLNENNSLKLRAWERLISEILRAEKAREVNISDNITQIDISSSERPKITVESRIVVDFGGFDDYDAKIPLLAEALRLNLAKQRGYFDFTDSKTGHFRPE